MIIYPVKSLAGLRQDRACVQPWGLAGDRRWMIIDPAGRFMTQREHPGMAAVSAVPTDDGLLLRLAGVAPLMVSPDPASPACQVQIWRDRVPAQDCGDAAARWLSAAFHTPCRLVHLANPHARKLDARYAAHAEEVVSFADGFPILLASEASLAALNARLGAPVPMARFRPNLVIAGAPAWAEDGWRRVRIGQVVFRVAKPCDRCTITTIDQATGERPDGNEPLTTLGRFRRDRSGKIMFAQNVVPENTGSIVVGDGMEILESGPPSVTAVSVAGRSRVHVPNENTSRF